MVYVSAGCLGITLISCVFLSWRHLHRYTSSQEQRQILRIANLPFFYSLFNFLALLFTIDYLFIEPLSGIYESFALAALFLLVLEFVVPDGTDREQYFDRLELRDKKGVKPGGSLKWFQVCVIQTRDLLVQIANSGYSELGAAFWPTQSSRQS